METNNTNDHGGEQLAHRALRVVLQHWMVPNLGWTTSIFEEKLPPLRQVIMENLPTISSDTQYEENRLKSHLENEFGYFADANFKALKEELTDTSVQDVLNELPTIEVKKQTPKKFNL
jgi:hypothetical protein